MGSRVAGDVVVQVGAGELHVRPAVRDSLGTVGTVGQVGKGRAKTSAPVVASDRASSIEPAAVSERANELAVWATAVLTEPLGTAEAHRKRKLAPVNRVEAA